MLPSANPDTVGRVSEGSVLSPHCLVLRQGLQFSADEPVPYDEWIRVGSHLKQVAGSVMFMIGDWLAYGQAKYVDNVWGRRMPNDIYRQIAQETGYAEGTLRNSKYVCTHIPLSLRSDKLTFNHAQALASKATQEQYPFWLSELEKNGWSVKEFWAVLRKAGSKHKDEPNDRGQESILELCRQFVRDFNSLVETAGETELRECGKVLTPVWQRMGG